MEYLFDVILDDDLEFSDYNLVLSSYPTWKSVYREIKLNYLLEGSKKLQFDIDDIQKYITLVSLENRYRCCCINGMTFILNNNKIERLTLKSKILDTECGKIVKSIIDTGVEIKVSQLINIQDKTLNFIIETPKNVA